MNNIPHLLFAFDPIASDSGGAVALALRPPPRWPWTRPGSSSSTSLLVTIIIIVATSWLFSMVWAG